MSRSNKEFFLVLFSFFWFALLAPRGAWAVAETPENRQAKVCGVVESFSGSVQILDAERSNAQDPVRRGTIACGSWIAVKDGALHFKHRDGHRVAAGDGTFLSLPAEGDQFLLYRGSVYTEAAMGGKELSVLTTNARARIRNSTAVVVYNDNDEESQLIALERQSTLENRFAPEKKMTVKAGEASFLNFKLLRVIPSAPRAVSLASLKDVLAGLNLSIQDQQYVAKNVERRADRKLASFPILPSNAEQAAIEENHPEMAEAAKKKKELKQAAYMRHQPSAVDQDLKAHWVGKFSGGSDLGTKYAGKRFTGELKKKYSVRVIDGARQRRPASAKVVVEGDQDEKDQLLEELRQLETE